MFQTTINYTMSEYNTNEIQATAIYNYKREALAFIGSKFEGVYIGGEGWKNPRLEISRIIFTHRIIYCCLKHTWYLY
jgi:hypothetical protein